MRESAACSKIKNDQKNALIAISQILTLSSGLVARGEGWLAGLENAWGQHVVPLLFDERMDA